LIGKTDAGPRLKLINFLKEGGMSQKGLASGQKKTQKPPRGIRDKGGEDKFENRGIQTLSFG